MLIERALPAAPSIYPQMQNRKRFLLTQRGCIELYPPVLHQAALLSSIGEVTVVDTLNPGDEPATQTTEDIRRVRVTTKPTSSAVSPILCRIQNLRRYSKTVRQEIAAGPDSMIAFEPEAARIMLQSSSRRTKRIVHLHEIPALEAYAESRSSTMALKYIVKNLDRAAAVIVPDHERATYLQQLTGSKVKPLVVMNCPRRLPQLPSSLLIPFLRERGIDSSKIVHYQGALGPDHHLEAVIKSMRFWPADAVFVVVGAGSEQYLNKLRSLTVAEGVERRVIFTGRLPYAQLFQYAIGASVGVTFLNSSILNFKFGAGASNKRFEYAALGIPQVTNDGPGIQNLFGATGIAAVADYYDVEDVGRKICRFLLNEARGREVGAKARALHLERYNYEQQFKKVLELLT